MANLFTKFFGRAASEGAGFAFGTASAPLLLPALEKLRQEAWGVYPDRIPDVLVLAAGVAQGQVDPTQAHEWAHGNGYGDQVFNALVDVANVGMPIGSAYQAWRRGKLTDAQFNTQLHRAAIETEWWAAMQALKEQLLEPAEIAKAVHRGIMADDGLLVAAPPTTPGKVPAVPPSSLDPVTEAAGSGVDKERLRIMVGNAGLPPGIVQMLQLLNRGEITESDFLRGVGESNLRNEWGPAILALRRRLLTPHEYEEAALRGVITKAQADAGAELSGMTQADAELLFEIMGRPLAVHQITTGLARGGVYGGDYTDIPEPYRDAVRRSNIRPEWARIAYANRYTIPSYFILKAILADGGMTEAEFAEYGKQLGWPPDLADKAAAAVAGGGGTATDPYVTKAHTQLWNTTHTSYKGEMISDADATQRLTLIGVPAASQPAVLNAWKSERELIRKQLTPAQVAKAYAEQVVNPATGQPWTQQDAIQALLDRGYSQADAQVLVVE